MPSKTVTEKSSKNVTKEHVQKSRQIFKRFSVRKKNCLLVTILLRTIAPAIKAKSIVTLFSPYTRLRTFESQESSPHPWGRLNEWKSVHKSVLRFLAFTSIYQWVQSDQLTDLCKAWCLVSFRVPRLKQNSLKRLHENCQSNFGCANYVFQLQFERH